MVRWRQGKIDHRFDPLFAGRKVIHRLIRHGPGASIKMVGDLKKIRHSLHFHRRGPISGPRNSSRMSLAGTRQKRERDYNKKDGFLFVHEHEYMKRIKSKTA
jgi:hypothetical protein